MYKMCKFPKWEKLIYDSGTVRVAVTLARDVCVAE